MHSALSRRAFVGSSAVGLATGALSSAALASGQGAGTDNQVDVAALAALAAQALPSDVATLPTIVAQPFAEVAPGSTTDALEGLVFDAEGAMYVCRRFREKVEGGRVTSSEICRIDGGGAVERLIYRANASFNGIAVHRDGRLFVADMSGRVWVYPALGGAEPDGEIPLDAAGPAPGFTPNDLVFDAATGDLYCTDFNGSMLSPTGGVYRFTAESGYQAGNEVIGGLVTPNGITFDLGCTNLYVSETALNRILKVSLRDGAANPGLFGCCVAYQGQGVNGPDSNRLDANGNLYQTFYPDGRAVVFNANLIPVANVVPFDRENGEGWKTTSLAIHPTKPEGYLVSGGTRGMWVLKFDALACSAPLWHLG